MTPNNIPSHDTKNTSVLSVWHVMQRRFADLPIRRKLMVIIGIALWVAMFVAAVAFIVYDERTSRQRLSSEMQVLAQVIAQRSGAAIAFGDSRAANTNVASLAFHPAVLSACLAAHDSNQPIGLFQRAHGDDAELATWDCRSKRAKPHSQPSSAFEGGFLIIRQPVVLKSNTIGELVLQVSLAQIQQRRWQFALVALVIQVVAGLLAYLLTARLQQMITRPLQDLSVVADKITGSHDYSLRAQQQGSDEVGAVVDAFNDMLHTIQEANHTLHEAMLELQEKREMSDAHARSANDRREEISEYFGGVSHDLRQPLHAMGLFVETLLAKGNQQREETHILGQLNESIRHQSEMLTELLDVSKLDAGVKQAKLRTFAIRPVLQRITNDFSVLAEDKLIRLTLSIFDEKHTEAGALSVHSDPIMLERVIRNLLSNAIRYTDDGGVLVACRVKQDATVSIEIWDTGKGIPKEQRASIFDAHLQLDNAEQDVNKGFGLGLSVVKRLTDTLGHPLTVDSVAGRGSVFKIGLPHVTVMATEPIKPMPHSLEGKRLLLVDDDSRIRTALGDLLRAWGVNVTLVATYEELTAASCPPIDMIITDYNLPHQRTGLDVIAWVQQQIEHADSPVPAIIITGETDEAVFSAIARAGYAYLAKPVKAAKLRAVLSNMG